MSPQVAAGWPMNGKRGQPKRRPPTTADRPIRCAYGDPVYLGFSAIYSKPGTPEYHPDAKRWDDPAEHIALMARMEAEFPDGWAMSASSDSLRVILPGAPPKTRVASWSRPAAGSLGVFRVAFAWEPVLYRTPTLARFGPGGEPNPTVIPRPTAMDWCVASVGHNSDVGGCGFRGAKPTRFCRWLFALLGLGGHPDDELVDLFPGSGAVTRAWQDYRAREVTRRCGDVQGVLFGGAQ